MDIIVIIGACRPVFFHVALFSSLMFAVSTSAIAGTEGYPTKMEEWSSVNRAAFPAAHNGIDKSTIDADIKYAQVKRNNQSINK